MRLGTYAAVLAAVAVAMTLASGLVAQEKAPAAAEVFPSAVAPNAAAPVADSGAPVSAAAAQHPAEVAAATTAAATAGSAAVVPASANRGTVPATATSTGIPTVRSRGAAHALRISSGDLLELAIFDTPELSGKVRVNEAGDIIVPVAGPLHLAGLTADEAAAAVERKLREADILKDPHVSIFIAEYATQGVTVTGEVKSPGIYPLMGTHGLVDLLSAAGGTTPTAGRVVSITHRSDPAHPNMVRLDSHPGKIADDIDIQPGDTIVVARVGVAYVVGDVAHPGGFLIEGNDRLTVLQIVALAQGTTRTSAADKARLIRRTENGREEMPLPLKSMMSGKVIDIPVEDGDILYVPSSKGKIYGARGLESILGLASGLAIGKL
jgi:polysaccharide export outer membrane protein